MPVDCSKASKSPEYFGHILSCLVELFISPVHMCDFDFAVKAEEIFRALEVLIIVTLLRSTIGLSIPLWSCRNQCKCCVRILSKVRRL